MSGIGPARDAIAAALSTVDGVTGWPRRPRTIRPGDGWPVWRGAERQPAGFAMAHTFSILLALPPAEQDADGFVDDHGDDLIGALEDGALFVTGMQPVTISAGDDGSLLGLQIDGRTE